jgi:hypothetical protein
MVDGRAESCGDEALLGVRAYDGAFSLLELGSDFGGVFL